MRRVLAAAGLVALALGSALAGPAAPQPPGPPPPMGGPGGPRAGAPGRGPNPILAPVAAILMHRPMLGLSDDQVARLQALHVENQKAVARQLADLYGAHLDLVQALGQPNVDRGKVETATRELGRRVSDLMLTQARAYLDALNILTPAQRQHVQQMITSAGLGLGMGMGMGRCPGCPMGMMGMGSMGMGPMGMGGAPMPPPPPAPGPGAP